MRSRAAMRVSSRAVEGKRHPRHQHLEHHARAARRQRWPTRAGSSACTSSIPVAQMPLVEVIASRSNAPPKRRPRPSHSPASIDKLPLPCRSAPGFVVQPRADALPDARRCWRRGEGVPLAVIDRAAAGGSGMPMGPIELADIGGARRLPACGPHPRAGLRTTRSESLAPLVEARKLGRKSRRRAVHVARRKAR